MLAGSAAATSVDRPSWTAGDFWTYRTSAIPIPGLNLSGTATSTVSGMIPTRSGGRTVDAFRILLTGEGTAMGNVSTRNGTFFVSGTWTLTGEERFEPQNLHPVYSLIDLRVNATVPIPFYTRVQNTTTYDVLADGWQYPWAVGTSGNVTLRFNTTQDAYNPAGHAQDNGTGVSTIGFSLAAPVSVNAGAGTFDAFPLLQTYPDGSWQLLYYAPAAGNNVQTEAHDRDGHLTSRDTLVAYRYQALESSSFLGLTAIQWAVVAGIAGVGIAAVFLMCRARREKATRAGRDQPSPESTSGPRGP